MVHHHRRRNELRLRTDHVRLAEALAVHLHLCRGADLPVWDLVLRDAQLACLGLVPHTGRARRCRRAPSQGPDGRALPEDQAVADQRGCA